MAIAVWHGSGSRHSALRPQQHKILLPHMLTGVWGLLANLLPKRRPFTALAERQCELESTANTSRWLSVLMKHGYNWVPVLQDCRCIFV